MSAAEINKIKLNLIAWINQLSDVDVLSFLDGIKSSRSKGDWWDNLNPEQQKIILKGIKEAENGKTMNSEKFWKSLKNA